MLNTAFISKLADFIEAESVPYDQRSWGSCVAAQACIMAGLGHKYNHSGEHAQQLLGIDEDQYLLFQGGPLGMVTPSKETAARVLRHLAATGEVDWLVKEPVAEKAELPATLTIALRAKPAAGKKAKRPELADT